MSINVRNNAPSAGNDSFMTLHNQPMTAFAPGLLANDYDMDGDSITPTLVTSTSHGTLALNSNGSFIYTPNAGYVGSDSFIYKVSDGLIDSNTATVSINVWNNVPSAGNDSFSLKHSQSFTTGLPGLLANDYDMDGDSLTISLVDHPLHGYVLINATSGGFKYVPDDEYVGVDSFTYEVTDGIAQSNLATVSLNLLDTKPNAVDDFFDDASSRVVSYFDIATILGNDSDLDDEHDSLVIDSIDAVSALGASISIVSGQLVYDPTGVAALQSLADDSVVSDVIGYAIKDPHAQLAFASINLQAKPNRPPTISKITNQITLKDKPTAGLEFDAKDHVNETAINAVTITATSSNQAVIANSGLAISTVLGSLRKNYRYSRSGGHR